MLVTMTLQGCQVPDTPFTRYNRLSNRLSNGFDNRLNVCIHDTTRLSNRLDNRFDNGFDNRLYRVYKHFTRFVKPV